MPSPTENISPTQRLAFLAILSTSAFVVGTIESRFPLPFPGMRLGIANAFPLTALLLFSPKDAITVAAARLFLAFFLSGNPFAFACSAAGLGLSLPIAIALDGRNRRSPDTFSVPAISVASATGFNLGQILAAVSLTKTPALFAYLPFLLAAALLTGYAVGKLAETLTGRLGKLLYNLEQRRNGGVR